MGVHVRAGTLLDYTEWERAQWHAWFHEQGPAALAVDLGPNSDGRVNTIGELVRHIFRRAAVVARIQGAPLTALPRFRPTTLKLSLHSARKAGNHYGRCSLPSHQSGGSFRNRYKSESTVARDAAEADCAAVTHEIRHWAQVATFLRMSGRKPGPRDFLVSPVLEP